MTKQPDRAEAVREAVRGGYGEIARSGAWSPAVAPAEKSSACCGGGGCCGGIPMSVDALAKQIGYTTAELASVPGGSNMGLSCGNPTAIASLKPGEVVLDLGSGGGFDCFVAGPKVGPTGRIIGVDMTAEMVSKARRNTAAYRESTGLDNVEFRLGEIENLPVADASVDVVVSNCVLNLSPDKERVWKEIARVLKPGGRAAISDLALRRPLPDSVRGMLEALIGCIAGAPLVDEVRAWAGAAGLQKIVLTPKPEYVAAMVNSGDPLYQRVIGALPPGTRIDEIVTSLDVQAVKPAACCCAPGCCGG